MSAMWRRWQRTTRAVGALIVAAAVVPAIGMAATPYPKPPSAHVKLTAFHDGVALGWRWSATTTTLVSAHIAVAGPDVTLTALYLRKRGSVLLWQLTADGQSEITTALAALERKSYRVGNRLQVTLSVPDELPQQATFTFRPNQIPSTLVTHPRPVITKLP